MTNSVTGSIIAVVILAFAATSGLAQQPAGLPTIPSSVDSITSLRVRDKVPHILVRAPDGTGFDLNRAFATKPTLILFYGKGWCPYCNIQLSELQEIEADLKGSGYQIIAVSTDSTDRIGLAASRYKPEYILVSDSELDAARTFGVVYGSGDNITIVPAAFLVDRNGVIFLSYVSSNYKVSASGDMVLEAARHALLR